MTLKPIKKIVAYKYKVYGKRTSFRNLDASAYLVNQVWNFCNETAEKVWNVWCGRSLVGGYRCTFQKTNKDGTIKTVDGLRIPYYHETNQTLQTLELTGGSIGNYDLEKLCAGVSNLMEATSGDHQIHISQSTISAICAIYATMRVNKAKLLKKTKETTTTAVDKKKKKPKPFMRFRGKKSRPFIPLKGCDVHLNGNILTYRKHAYKINLDRPVAGRILDGKFVKENDGWFVCLTLEVEDYDDSKKPDNIPLKEIGVDLGLKTFATTSDGQKLEGAPEPELTIWGRKKKITEHIKDFQSLENLLMDKRSTRSKTGRRIFTAGKKASKKEMLVRKKRQALELQWTRFRDNTHYNNSHDLLDMAETVVVGDLSCKFIQKTHGKKSKETAIGDFKTKLEWTAKKRGQNVFFVNEKYTTQTCSQCGDVSGPKGLEGLSIREWTCTKCGTHHDRDVNAAKNILEVLKKPAVKSDTEEQQIDKMRYQSV